MRSASRNFDGSPLRICIVRSNSSVINSDFHVVQAPGPTALISAIKAENADMLVMGCYGRNRLYEYVLGGASRHLLRETPVPLLMSH